MFANYVFVLFCSIANFLYLFVRRNESRLKQVVGPISIWVVAFLLVYCFPLSNIDPLILSVFYPIFVCAAVIFFTSISTCNENSLEKNYPVTLFSIMLLLGQFFALFIFWGFPWVKETFSIDDADAVLFTMRTSKEGAWCVVWYSFFEEVFIPTMKALFVCWVSLALILTGVYASKKCFCLTFFQKKFFICKKNKVRNFIQGNVLIFVVLVGFAIMSIPILGSSAIDIYNAYSKMDEDAVNSILYRKYYENPNMVSISVKEKKNLIFIMLESMEVNALHYTPELLKIKENYVSFLPGGESIVTQGWTIGSQIAKYCGIPLKFPVYEGINKFLPNAVCIQDLLDKYDYNQLFVQGTDKKFASLEYFFETHSRIEMHDYTYYVSKERAEEKIGGWGIDDFALFDLLKEDITKISEQNEKPFAVYAMTMDTHWPSGVVSEKCISKNDYHEINKEDKYRKVLACASKNMNDFLEWAKQQSWYSNTVLVIQGDHTQPKLSRLIGLDSTEHLYWYNTFINVESPVSVERKFSSFDMYPTVIEAMGFEIENHKLGLGASLFSKAKTLLEIMGQRQLDSLLNLKDSMDLYFSGIN